MGSLRRSVAVVLPLLLHLASLSNGFVVHVQNISPANLAEGLRRSGEVGGTSVPSQREDLILDEITISDKNSGNVKSRSAPATDKVLALIVNKNEFEKRLNNSSGDQDPAASEPIFLNLQEFRDVENLEDVLSITGYEPQKIESKSKRKVTRASNDYPGQPQIRTVPPPLPVNNEKANGKTQYAVVPSSFQNVGQYSRNTDYSKPILTAAVLHPVQPIASEKLFITPPSTLYPLATASQNLNVAQTTFLVNPTEEAKFNDGRLRGNVESSVARYVGLDGKRTKARDSAQLAPTSSSLQYAEPTKRRKAKARGRHREQASSSDGTAHALSSSALPPVQERADNQGRQSNFVLKPNFNVVPRPFSLPPATETSYQPLNTAVYPLKPSSSVSMNTERANVVAYKGRSTPYDGVPTAPARFTDVEPVTESKDISAQAAFESYDDLTRSIVKSPSAENGRRFDNTDEQSVKSVEILRVKEKPQTSQRTKSHGRGSAKNAQGSYAAHSQPVQYKINERSSEVHGHGQDRGYDNAHGKYSHYDGEPVEASGSEKYSENYESGQDHSEGVGDDGRSEQYQGHFIDHGAYQDTGEDYENYHDDQDSDGGHDESGASSNHEGYAKHLEEGQDGSHGHGNYQQVDRGSPGGFGHQSIEQLRQKYQGPGQDHGDYRRHDEGYEEAVEEHSDQKDAASGGGNEGGHGGGGGDGGHGGGNYKFEKGGGGKTEEEHHESHGQEGDKGYKSWHENDKAQKGHHDKERHSKQYDEANGDKKEHDDEGGYHEEHHQDEEGEKGAKFNEKGEHNKGHSTKGEHFVHKKDEYEKKTEFFDEFHEGGDSEKDGEYYHEHEEKKGDHKKVGHYEEKDHDEKYGKQSKYAKGGHHHDGKGHKVSEGHDHHYDHDSKYGKKGEEHDGKKWMYKKSGGGKEH